MINGEEKNLLLLALRSYNRPQDRGEPTWREWWAAVIEYQPAFWIAFQLALAVLKCLAVPGMQASGFAGEGRLHICLVVCWQFWIKLLGLVGHQSIPIRVMTVVNQGVILTEMIDCRVVSCPHFVTQFGLGTLEVMEAKLLLRCWKHYVQIRTS